MDFSTSESQTRKKKQILDKESSESLDSPKKWCELTLERLFWRKFLLKSGILLSLSSKADDFRVPSPRIHTAKYSSAAGFFSMQNTYHFFFLPSFFILHVKVVSREHRMQLTFVSLDRVEKLETNTSLTICFLWCFCSLLKSLELTHMVFARQ